MSLTKTARAISLLIAGICLVVPVEATQVYYTDIVEQSGTAAILRRVNSDGTGMTTLVTGLKHPRGMALDVVGGKLYWTEPGISLIRRANLDGAGSIESVVAVSDTAGGLALDVAAGKIYWTGGNNDPRIRRANLDGTGIEDLVTSSQLAPVGIALDPVHGKIYWTDLEGNLDGTGSIKRANLNGSDVETLLTGIDEAAGIACDVMGGKIYWTELATKKIQRANLDGTGVEDLVVGLVNPTTISLDLVARKMYWTDSIWFAQPPRIQKANLDGSSVEVVVSGVGFPWGIAVESLSPADGLVAYYPFEGNANDESGNGNNAVVTGAILATNRFGVVSDSYLFTAPTQYVTTSSSVGMPTGTNDFAISLWVALNFLTNDHQIVFCNASVNDCQLDVGPTTTGTTAPMDFVMAGRYGSADVHIADVSWMPNQWYSLQIVRSQNVVTIYRDGAIIGQNPSENGVNAPAEDRYLRFGHGVAPQLHQLYGQLDDIRIYNRALSVSEVAGLYSAEAPAPPSISSQPQSVTVAAGSATNFSVTVTGSERLRYQWVKDGVALPGATNATLLFANVQPVNIGDYKVVVSNGGGSVTSSVASLTIPGVPTGLWQGLVAYYPFSGNALDASGHGNNGTVGSVGFELDRFGVANATASFAGNASSRITIPTTNLNLAPDFTVTVWVNPTAGLGTDGPRVISTAGYELGVNYLAGESLASPNRAVVMNVTDVGNSGTNTLPTNAIRTGEWSQAVGVWTANGGTLYVNGVVIGAYSTTLRPDYSRGFVPAIGGNSGSGADNFGGLIDDLRIYNRALSGNDVAQLYALDLFCSPHRAEAIASLSADGVTGATMVNLGCGYTNAPSVRIVGGGGSGATATATMSNGIVTDLVIASAGSGYTNAPRIYIESPPFVPTVSLAVSKVKVTQKVRVNHNYVLEASLDLVTWTATGPGFTAESESIVSEFDVVAVGQFYRLREVP